MSGSLETWDRNLARLPRLLRERRLEEAEALVEAWIGAEPEIAARGLLLARLIALQPERWDQVLASALREFGAAPLAAYQRTIGVLDGIRAERLASPAPSAAQAEEPVVEPVEPEAAQAEEPVVEPVEPEAAQANEPEAIEANEPEAIEANEPEAIEANEPEAIEANEPEAIEANEPEAAQAEEPVVEPVEPEAAQAEEPVEPEEPAIAAVGEEPEEAAKETEPLPKETDEPLRENGAVLRLEGWLQGVRGGCAVGRSEAPEGEGMVRASSEERADVAPIRDPRVERIASCLEAWQARLAA
ncbi:hypothetical protein SIID45300_00230 [Candidatus Magnetaquicoccaceae bacterium FCR-1]|uniref:Uncharacterized protein n=1 Tax=Candidatus Magnetaquiglobus chichijimensis TaxID=3141448 RepID=A0ABQ0C4X1_9PROT